MKAIFKKTDKLLLFLMIAFTIFGLIMIFSASSITAVLYNGLSEHFYFQKHLYIIIATWIFGMLVLVYPTHKYKIWGPLGIIAIIAALAGLFPYGTFTNNVRSWYDLGFFSFQPSEFAKSIIIVYLAVSLDKIHRKGKYTLNKLSVPFLFVLIIFGLTLIQPDLGTAAIIGGIAFLIFLALPSKDKNVNNFKKIGIFTVIACSLFIIYGGKLLTEEQSSRLTYKEPCTRYTEKTGYQVCNGFIAISNGGLIGAGLGNSTQKYLYLPEAYTDFIFPVIIEEWGAIIGILIILLFLVLLYRILKIAKNASNLKGSIIAYGTFSFILLHLLINFLGVLAFIPLTGVPVPFLSYGGSFYINIMFMLFLTQRVQIETLEFKQKEVLK
ncbi:MAG: FtsW/RodA/SpoVE family cell cycle protein [Bacilli bacterium]|nr:FtsW/RodA/SpoVE family cell cycle protein [Bacilli bacterium]